MSETTTETTSDRRRVDQGGGVDSSFLALRRPDASDGADIWRLVAKDGTLEPNSAYAYLLVGAHFCDTSVIARRRDEIAGFVWGYRIPDRPDTVFIWQIGVTESGRGRGLGAAMLREIRRRPACADIRFMEATVTPSNQASMALFRSFARSQDARFDVTTGFDRCQFPDPRHETEMLVRIGPFHPLSQGGANRKE